MYFLEALGPCPFWFLQSFPIPGLMALHQITFHLLIMVSKYLPVSGPYFSSYKAPCDYTEATWVIPSHFKVLNQIYTVPLSYGVAYSKIRNLEVDIGLVLFKVVLAQHLA